MKESRIIIGSFILFVGVVFITTGFMMSRDDQQKVINTGIKTQKKAYNRGDYKQAYEVSKLLIDSLKAPQPELKFNFSNAAFYMAVNDSSKYNTVEKDSTSGFFAYMTTATNNAKAVAESTGNKQLSSEGYNHLGVFAVKSISAADAEERALGEARDHFKNALDTDDENEMARFNYELITRKLTFPERVINQVKSLINQRKYRDAREVLKKAVKQDNRVKLNYGDFVNRIDNIIKIDSLSRS